MQIKFQQIYYPCMHLALWALLHRAPNTVSACKNQCLYMYVLSPFNSIIPVRNIPKFKDRAS